MKIKMILLIISKLCKYYHPLLNQMKINKANCLLNLITPLKKFKKRTYTKHRIPKSLLTPQRETLHKLLKNIKRVPYNINY